MSVHVVVASRIFAPEPAAASFRLDALVTALSDAGAKVTVLTVTTPPADNPGDTGDAGDPAASDPTAAELPARDPQATRDPRPGVKVRRWPVLRDASGYVRGYAQYMSFDIPLFFRLLFVPRVDAVIAEPPPTTGAVVRLVCALRRIPYVYYGADVWSDATESIGTPGVVVRALRAVESWALKGAAGVIAVSEGVAERVRALGARRVQVIRNGIDTTVFTPDGPRAVGAPTGPYAVYAGTTSEWQGADIFVQAMGKVAAEVPGARLVVVGQGSGWELLELEAAQLPDAGACVELLPPVPAAQAAQWQRGAVAALVSLRPGLGYDFALPTKIFAGLASGAPVLFAGPTGVASELINDNDLGVAVPYDVDAVAGALTQLLAKPCEPARRAQLAAWARDNASAAAAARQVAALVGRLAQAHRRGRMGRGEPPTTGI